MKTFSGAKGKTLDRGAAMACAGINLFATPGLGSIIAGRYLAGGLQLLAACMGFVLLMWWYYYLMQAMLNGGSAGHGWMWQLGLVCFAIGWFGSLWTSLDILKQAKAKTPPKLDGTRG